MQDFLMWAGGIIATGLFGLIGWIINMILGRLKDHEIKCDTRFDAAGKEYDALRTSLDAHRLYAAETYTTKVDVNAAKTEIIRQIERLTDKIYNNPPSKQ